MQNTMVNLHQSVSVITQRLYKIEEKYFIKTITKIFKNFGYGLLFFISITAVYTQDSIPVSKDKKDKFNEDFHEFFFQAITNKAINNYQKAINNLDACNKLVPNNVTILFELSKNYYKLKKYIESIAYAKEALIVEPKNTWVLEHMVAAQKGNSNFKSAISYQKKLIRITPEKKQDLVFLYMQYDQIDSAKLVLNELKSTKRLTPRLRRIHKKLDRYQKSEIKNNDIPNKKINQDNVTLELQFKNNKSFTNLKQLLNKLDKKNDPKLLEYSDKGITLFPAQPFVYLMNAKALNKMKRHKKAVLSLKNGIDFVIDNPALEHQYYNEFVISYQGLGDIKNEGKYRKKLIK